MRSYRTQIDLSTSLGCEGVPPTLKVDPTEFKCPLCPTRCKQRRVLLRHYREKHQRRLECLEHNCDHEWIRSRESYYREHLRKEHGRDDDTIDEMLGRPARRRLDNLKDRVVDPPPHTSTPSMEYGRRSLAKPQQRPLMLPLLAEGKYANHTPPSVIPSVAQHPQLGHAEPEVTTTKHDDSNELEHHAPTHAPSRLLSFEDTALLGEYYRLYGAFRFPPVHPTGPTTADIPFYTDATSFYTPISGFWRSSG